MSWGDAASIAFAIPELALVERRFAAMHAVRWIG